MTEKKPIIWMLIAALLIVAAAVGLTLLTHKSQPVAEKPVTKVDDGNGGMDLTAYSPTYQSPVPISFLDPTTGQTNSFSAESHSVIKQTNGDLSYADFFIEDTWVKQNQIDSAQSAEGAKYKSTLESVTTSSGMKGQRFTQTDNGKLVTQYYFFDLNPERILFVQSSVEPDDQKVVQQIINSIKF